MASWYTELREGAMSFNHTLTVGASSAPCAESSLRLWFFDSGGNHDDPAVSRIDLSGMLFHG